MNARVAVPLGILAAAFVLPILFTPALFAAWSLTFAGLFLLSREPEWRRAARSAMMTLGGLLVVSAIGAGLIVGWRGRTFLAGPEIPGAEWFAYILVACGILATGVLLLTGPVAASRRMARWAVASCAILFLVMALVSAGEKIAGLIGLFGALTLLFVAAGLLAALRSSRESTA